MNFQNLEISDFLKKSLNNIENQNRMPHAVIIDGGNEETRNSLALHLAKWAVCSGKEKPCEVCKNCINANSKNHSDIYYLQPDKKLKTEKYSIEVMKRFIADTIIKPNQANKKVYILEKCEKRLPIDSQNLFLKTMEEPPQDIMFILCCENSSSLLPTILSRATVFSLKSQVKIQDEALALSKEIALNLIVPQEYALLSSLNKLSTRELFTDAMEGLIQILRDGLAISVGGKAISHKDIVDKLSKRLTKAHYIKLIELSQDAEIKVSQNVSLKLLSTWLCGEYRRILWQR